MNDNQPSLWKAVADHERLLEEERVTNLKRKHLMHRGEYFTWQAPANDNQAWPLIEQLRRDSKPELISVAERYLAIYDAAHVDVPLIGTMPDPDMVPDQRVHNRADGSVGYKGTRKVKGAVGQAANDDGCYKAVAVTDDAWQELTADNTGTDQSTGKAVAKKPITFKRRPGKPVTKKWAGDNLLIASIDSRRDLPRLQSLLGVFVVPFEDAVLHRMKLTEIGESIGSPKGTAGAEAKRIVMFGLSAMEHEFILMDRKRTAA